MTILGIVSLILSLGANFINSYCSKKELNKSIEDGIAKALSGKK